MDDLQLVEDFHAACRNAGISPMPYTIVDRVTKFDALCKKLDIRSDPDEIEQFIDRLEDSYAATLEAAQQRNEELLTRIANWRRTLGGKQGKKLSWLVAKEMNDVIIGMDKENKAK